MNDLLQKYGCVNVFHIPEGLRELMADISREVLRAQPKQLLTFIANYLSVLLITREHGIMTVKILDDLCDCRPTVSDHLIEIGLDKDQSKDLAQIIHDEISGVQPTEGKEKVREIQIMKKILKKHPLEEEFSSKVIQVIRNAYRDYWYRKKVMQQSMKMRSDEPWQKAAINTLEIYKRTKPSIAELTRATQRIQAAYRAYHVRRKLLDHLKKPKKQLPKVALGPPVDVAESRDIDLGPVINIKVKVDNVEKMFEKTKITASIRYSGPPTPSLLLDEEDDASHHHTLDIMSTRTDDNQTLSRYGVAVEDNKSSDDDYGGVGGQRISFAVKPFIHGASDASENKDEVAIPEAVIAHRSESPASTPVDDDSEPDLPDDTIAHDAPPHDALINETVLEVALLEEAVSDEVKSEADLPVFTSQKEKSGGALLEEDVLGSSIINSGLPEDILLIGSKPYKALPEDSPEVAVAQEDIPALRDDVAKNEELDNDAFDNGNEADIED